MGEIIDLAVARRAREARRGRLSTVEIIAASFAGYIDQMVRQAIPAERLRDPHQRAGLGDSLVRGWFNWCEIEARSERLIERERAAYAVIAASSGRGRVYEEAVVQCLARLAALAAEAAGPGDDAG